MNLLSAKFKLLLSLKYGAILLFIHIGAIFCVYSIHISMWVKITLTSCILTNLILFWKSEIISNGARAIGEFWLDHEGKWHLQRNSGEEVLASISYPIFVSSYLIVIVFVLENKGKKVSLPIFKGMLVADDFRKLKMILKAMR